MHNFLLSVDEQPNSRGRGSHELVAAASGVTAALVGPALFVITGANLPYLFVVAAVSLNAMRGGLVPGVIALAIGMAGVLLLNAANSVVQLANSVTVLLLCLAIAACGEALLRLRVRERLMTRRCHLREMLLQRMFDASQAVILILDETDRIAAVNEAGCRLFGLSREELGGIPVADILDSPNAMKNGLHVIRTSRGLLRHVRLAASDFRIEHTRFRTLYIRDETAAINAADALATTQQELNQLARAAALGQLGSAIAHELNQPLAAAINYTGAASAMLRRLEPKPLEAVDTLAEATAQIMRAAAILGRLRTFVGHASPASQWTDVHDVVSEAGKLGSLALTRSGAILQVSVDADAGEVLVDPIQVQQVLLNLLVNAADAVRDCPVRVVRLDAQVVDVGELALTVEDSGPGIPPALIDTVFLPFHSTKADGLGVGLAISSSIIAGMGGTISCTNGGSEGGAVFRVTLPRRAIEKAPR